MRRVIREMSTMMTESLVQWPVWRTAQVNLEMAKALAKSCNLPLKVAKWCCLRGLEQPQEVVQWLNHAETLSDPFAFVEMNQALLRIKNAILNQERIGIVGDYDVDGVTSSAILASTLAALGADYRCFIPHRVQDGYGLCIPIVHRALAENCKLMITVDNGIRALEAMEYALANGIDIIMTDHHEPGEVLPEGIHARIHWQWHRQPEDAKQLSGAGVAWKLCDALLQKLWPENTILSPSFIVDLQDFHLGLAALGTLADVMPVKGENRRLIREGVEKLRNLHHVGWLALCHVSGIVMDRLNIKQILWRIAPRINAAGRIASAEVAFRLFMANQQEEAQTLAEEIEQLNRLRKMATDDAIAEAIKQCETVGDEPSILVVAGPWHLGIVGIVAAKLVDKYQCPAIVFSDTGERVLRGSGRAPEGYKLYDLVEQCGDLLQHFGGHASAIGCGIDRDQFTIFQNVLTQVVTAQRRSVLHPFEKNNIGFLAEDYLSLREATLELWEWLNKFAPYGPGNPPFTFFLGPVEVVKVMPMSGGKHVRIQVREGQEISEIIWFQVTKEVLDWRRGDWISAIVTLDKNEWQGVIRAQIQVSQAWKLESPLTRQDLGQIYRLLQKRGKIHCSELKDFGDFAKFDEIQLIFDIFIELGFAELHESAYHIVHMPDARDLRDSVYYQNHLRNQCRLK